MKKFTVAGIVRARFEQIEKMMYEGMTQTAIVESLNEELKDDGFATTVENFRNELYRARKKREAMGLGKFDPSKSSKNSAVTQATNSANKTPAAERPAEQHERPGAISLPVKPEEKVYGGTPSKDKAKDLF